MAHCKPEQLSDIEDVLSKIRNFEFLKEKKHGVFYYKSKGFLHFHEKDGKRWADSRCGENWGNPIDLPFNPTTLQKKKFMKEINGCYLETVSFF